MRALRVAALVLSGSTALTASAVYGQKLGLSSSFGDVTLQNMKVGTPYALRQLKGHGYAITNISEIAIEAVVDVMPPLQGSLRPYYEEIPDTAWVSVSPKTFKLEPGQTAEGEVVIKVPEDGNWKDRNFQCALYAHTLQGSFVNVGIYDKLLLSTGKGPDAIKAKGEHVALVPATLRLGRLKPGRTFDSSAAKARLRLRNAAETAVAVTLQAVPFEGAAPKGYAAADPAALRFEAKAVSAQPGQTVDAPFKLDLAADAAGRKLAFRVKAVTEGGKPAPAYGIVLVEGTPPAAPKTKAKG